MLTKVDDIGVAGISGVEWDVWSNCPASSWKTSAGNGMWFLTHHVDTGALVARALFDKMTAAKNFQSGMMTLRQIEFSLFDMRLHAEAGNDQRVQAVLDEVRQEVAVNIPPSFNRDSSTAFHILPAVMLRATTVTSGQRCCLRTPTRVFEEAADGQSGVLNTDVGRRYREAILEAGGSRSAMENFKGLP